MTLTPGARRCRSRPDLLAGQLNAIWNDCRVHFANQFGPVTLKQVLQQRRDEFPERRRLLVEDIRYELVGERGHSGTILASGFCREIRRQSVSILGTTVFVTSLPSASMNPFTSDIAGHLVTRSARSNHQPRIFPSHGISGSGITMLPTLKFRDNRGVDLRGWLCSFFGPEAWRRPFL